MRAMILAAGRGERLRPLTDTCPKPLLPVGGRPLIEWHLHALARAGFVDVVINHAHLGELIERTLGDGSRWGLRLHYSPEAQALETAGGIAKALPLLGDDPFLVVNGDVFTDLDFSIAPTLARRVLEERLSAWCVMVDNPEHHSGGDFGLIDERLTTDPAAGPATFSGIAVYRPSMFDDIAPGTKLRLRPVLEREIAARRVGAHRHTGWWVDVGTVERLAEVDAHCRRLARGQTQG